MRASVTDCVRAVLRLALWTVPIPFGAFASDKGLFVSLSVLVFILASLSLPITVRRRQMKGTGTSQYASVGAILYGGIVALCVAVAILNGLMAYPFLAGIRLAGRLLFRMDDGDPDAAVSGCLGRGLGAEAPPGLLVFRISGSACI